MAVSILGDAVSEVGTAGITTVVVRVSTSDMAHPITTTPAIMIRHPAAITTLTAIGTRIRAVWRPILMGRTEVGIPSR